MIKKWVPKSSKIGVQNRQKNEQILVRNRASPKTRNLRKTPFFETPKIAILFFGKK